MRSWDSGINAEDSPFKGDLPLKGDSCFKELFPNRRAPGKPLPQWGTRTGKASGISSGIGGIPYFSEIAANSLSVRFYGF